MYIRWERKQSMNLKLYSVICQLTVQNLQGPSHVCALLFHIALRTLDKKDPRCRGEADEEGMYFTVSPPYRRTRSHLPTLHLTSACVMAASQNDLSRRCARLARCERWTESDARKLRR